MNYELATRFLDDLPPERFWTEEEVKKYKYISPSFDIPDFVQNHLPSTKKIREEFYGARGFNRNTHPQKKMEALIEYFDFMGRLNRCSVLVSSFNDVTNAIAGGKNAEALWMLEDMYARIQ